MNEHVKTVCKIGQGHDCCRYIAMSPKGWECMKIDPALKRSIDSRVQSMNAQGDNCDGKTADILNAK